MAVQQELRLDIKDQFEDLRSISDTVNDYIQRELYLETYGAYGEYTVNNVLRDCYLLVLEELSSIGIRFTRDEEEMTDDWYTAKQIYCLSYIFSTEEIKKWIVQEDILSYMESLLDEDAAPEKDIAQLTLSCVTAWGRGQMEYEFMQSYTDDVVSTSDFREYLKQFVTWARDTDRAIVMPDAARVAKYIAKIQESRRVVRTYADRILQKKPNLKGFIDMQKLEKRLQDYDLDKLAPGEIHMYSIFDSDDVSSYLEESRRAWMDKHHKRSPHHWEYWAARTDVHPTLEDIVVMVAHIAEPGMSPSDYRDEILVLLGGGKLNFLTEEQKKTFEELSLLVAPTDRGTDEDWHPKMPINPDSNVAKVGAPATVDIKDMEAAKEAPRRS